MGIPTQAIPDLTALSNLSRSNLLIVHDGTDMKKVTLQQLEKYFIPDGAGSHNGVYRGKYLGDTYTAAQKAAIAAGTFDDLFIGDYWTIGGFNWRIAAFDYFYQQGDTAVTKHHATLVPDTRLYQQRMNASNTTEGGYIGSEMYTSGLDSAKNTIKAAFGESFILTCREYLSNAVTNGKVSGGAWCDSQVDLMTEENVYGAPAFHSISDGTTICLNHRVDKSQYPLFFFRPDLINCGANRIWYWLRDVVSAAHFALVDRCGSTSYGNASDTNGVRPRFSIVGS